MKTLATTARLPVRTHRTDELLVISALAYLTLAIALGVHAAFWLVIASTLITGWVLAYRRFSLVRWFTLGFVGGFIRGLSGR
jgi:hypothetical protein